MIAGGIVRNRAWCLDRHLDAVFANRPGAAFYVTGDNIDDTVAILRRRTSVLEHSTGFPGYERSGEHRYHSSNMGPLRNLWASEAVLRWPSLTHLWVVDSDVIPRPDALSRLLAINKDVVGAWVPGCTPCAGWDMDTHQAARTGKEHLEDGPFPATMLGGCYLISRSAWDRGLRWGEHPQGEDGFLGDSARALGISLWADPGARCDHLMRRDR